MSETLGLKAVSRVDETDRFPFLKALAHIAAADDSVDLNEKQMVEQYSDAWDLDSGKKAEVQDILRTQSSLSLRQLVSEFSESGTRFLLVQELMRLAYADGTYGKVERKEIASIAHRLGMSEDQFREVEKWVGRGQAWGATSGEADDSTEEDLERVLDQDDEDQHDLSDIQTNESDLSDIDSNLNEVQSYESDEEEDADDSNHPGPKGEADGDSGTD